MTDLSRLKVSLTKHNAHKVALLLKQYDATEVFDHLDDVGADHAQARKNLSTLTGGVLPPVWAKAKTLGEDAIDALVLVAIIFSHRDLVTAVRTASKRKGFSGRIERNKQLKGKAYTNFVQIVDSLAYATRRDKKGVTFDFKPMFELPGLAPLVRELLELKLVKARWDQGNTVAQEAAHLDFNEVFGVTKDELVAWLNSDAQPSAAGAALLPKDEEFFGEESEGTAAKPFEFKPGHIDRDVDPVTRAASAKSKANRLHNNIQNKLFAYLKGKHGAKSVGTEQDTGSGTSIDVVTEVKGQTTFYEIKTGASVRSSIRQAIPQLLEYAFWPAEHRAHELVIVSHLPLTADGDQYLNFLRAQFKLPLSYRQFDLTTDTLV